MKNKLLQAFFVATTLLAGMSGYAQQWAPAGTLAFSPSNINLTSLAIGKNDTPYIAYLDDAHNDAVSVMKYNGSAWVNVGAPGFSNTVAPTSPDLSLILKIDTSGKLYVFYEDSVAPPFSVMTYNGSNWVYIDSAGIAVSQSQPYGLSMDIDAGGTPYIAFFDFNHSYAASVMKHTNAGWAYVGAQNFTPGGADYLSLAIDRTGTPWLAFADGSVNGKLSVQKFNGSNWLLQGAEGFSNGQYGIDHPVKLKFDNNNTPYIAYEDPNSNYMAVVRKFNGSDWVAVGDTDFTADGAYFIDFQITSGNVPVVAYSDKSNNYKASVMYFNGATWTGLGTPDFSTGEADWVSLAVTKHGVPYVGFVDFTDGHAASVYSFGIPASISEVSAAAAVTVYPNPNSGNFNLKIQSPVADELSLSVYDIVGQMVWSAEPVKVSGSYSTNINLSDMAKGTYLLQVKSGAGMSTQKLELIK